jgi:hypothetical protein
MVRTRNYVANDDQKNRAVRNALFEIKRNWAFLHMESLEVIQLL